MNEHEDEKPSTITYVVHPDRKDDVLEVTDQSKLKKLLEQGYKVAPKKLPKSNIDISTLQRLTEHLKNLDLSDSGEQKDNQSSK